MPTREIVVGRCITTGYGTESDFANYGNAIRFIIVSIEVMLTVRAFQGRVPALTKVEYTVYFTYQPDASYEAFG